VAVFVATWCPFCRRFIDQARGREGELAGREVVLVDVSDEDDPIWERERIDVVPTAVRYEGGREIDREPGVLGRGLPFDKFRDFVSKQE
jgi:thiol-disulfide isomerase/thioredoxin